LGSGAAVTQPKSWCQPEGLVIQPGSILVPGRVGYTPSRDWDGALASHFEMISPYGEGRSSWLSVVPSPAGVSGNIGRSNGPTLSAVSIPRWDLSGLTLAEIDSLAMAIDAQRLAGVGRPCAATVADRDALREGDQALDPAQTEI